MSDSKLRRLSIDRELFTLAFGRDVDFHDPCPTSTYLDLRTGAVYWVYQDDNDAYLDFGIPIEDKRASRERVKATPNLYLEIPGLNHGDHHEILREFLESDGTEDAEERERARNAYSGSVGGWKKSQEDESIAHAFYDYRDQSTTQMAEDFLRKHGIEPDWR